MSKDNSQQGTFEEILEGKPIPLLRLGRMEATSCLDPLRLLITHMPGPLGYGVRRFLFQ